MNNRNGFEKKMSTRHEEGKVDSTIKTGMPYYGKDIIHDTINRYLACNKEHTTMSHHITTVSTLLITGKSNGDYFSGQSGS